MAMVYDLPTVDAQTKPSAQFQAPESHNYAADQAQSMGKAMMQAGEAAFKIEMMAAEAGAKQDDSALFDYLLKAETSYKQTNGQQAWEGKDAVVKAARAKADEIKSGIKDPLRRDIFGQVAQKRLDSFASGVESYALGNLKEWRKAEDFGRLELGRTAAYNQWSMWNTENSPFTTAMKDYENRIKEAAGNLGVGSGAAYEAFRATEMTKLHTAVLGAMMSNGQSKMAKEYYGKHLNDIDVDQRKAIEGQIKVAATATEGDDLAAQIWGELAPKDRNGAIPLFQMTQKARELAGDNEDVQKAAIAGLKERAGEWNGEQAEFKAQNANTVWGMIDSGKSMKQIQTSPAWLSMSDLERHQVRKQMEEEATVRANRAAAQSQKELAELERNERLAFMQNGDAYLTATDPNVLKGMTRAQVEAQRGKFGMSATQHLLDRWDQVHDPKKFGEVKMDSDDFNNVALGLGLDPYSKDKGTRNQVGALKFHIEQAIDLEQQNRTKPMTRQEKLEFVKKELSKQVLVDRWGPFNKTKPALALTNDERKNLMIPAEERAAIVSDLQAMYQKYPNNPSYALTEANVRRLYLKKLSPGAAADYEETE